MQSLSNISSSPPFLIRALKETGPEKEVSGRKISSDEVW